MALAIAQADRRTGTKKMAEGFVRGLKQVPTKRKKSMKRARRKELVGIIGYFERNQARMPYQAFFEVGYPFASGPVDVRST